MPAAVKRSIAPAPMFPTTATSTRSSPIASSAWQRPWSAAAGFVWACTAPSSVFTTRNTGAVPKCGNTTLDSPWSFATGMQAFTRNLLRARTRVSE